MRSIFLFQTYPLILTFLSVILLYGSWASHSNLHLKGIQNLKHLPQISAFWVHLVRGWIIHLSYFHTAQLLEKSLTLPERDIAAVSPDKAGVWFKIFAAPRRFSNTSSNGKWNTIYRIWNGINSNLYFSWKIHRLYVAWGLFAAHRQQAGIGVVHGERHGRCDPF